MGFGGKVLSRARLHLNFDGTTVNEAFKILKEYDLLLNHRTRWSEDTGKRPQRIEPRIDKRQLNLELKKYEDLLNQTMRFRDAVKKKVALPEID